MIPCGVVTITLYNRRETKDVNGRTVVTWYRRSIGGCSWMRKTNRIWDGTAVILANTIICRIPEHPAYREPQDWDALTSPTGYFTLAPGDIIVRGTVTDTIGTSLSDAALIEKYKRGGAFVVAAAKNNVHPGLLLEHYLAEGA